MSDPSPQVRAVAAKPGRRSGRTAARARGNDEVKLGILNEFIGFNLRQAQDAAFRAFVRLLGQRDFKAGRFAVMMVIHYNPGITQSVLGRAIARDKSTVTPLLQDLHRQGLIARQPLATDRRSVTLTLTAEGERVLAELLRHVREHDRRLDRIAGAAKPALLKVLKKIAAALR